MSDSLQPHGLYSPWNSPGRNTGVGSLSLLQGIFPTQESNWGLLHCRRILYQLSYEGSLKHLIVCLIISGLLDSRNCGSYIASPLSCSCLCRPFDLWKLTTCHYTIQFPYTVSCPINVTCCLNSLHLWHSLCLALFFVQSLSCVRLFATPWMPHSRFPWPSLSPGACSDSCPLSRWCQPAISPSVTPFSSCPQSFPASGPFPVSWYCASGDHSTGVSASASVLPMNIRGCFPSGLACSALYPLNAISPAYCSVV